MIFCNDDDHEDNDDDNSNNNNVDNYIDMIKYSMMMIMEKMNVENCK